MRIGAITKMPVKTVVFMQFISFSSLNAKEHIRLFTSQQIRTAGVGFIVAPPDSWEHFTQQIRSLALQLFPAYDSLLFVSRFSFEIFVPFVIRRERCDKAGFQGLHM